MSDKNQADVSRVGGPGRAGGEVHATREGNRRLSAEASKSVSTIAGALLAVGVVLCVAAVLTDARRFAFSYLTGFAWVVTLGLGALFFVLLQHLTRSGWSVVPRRAMEWVMNLLPLSAVLFIPVAVLARVIYFRWLGPEALHDELVQKKAAWLNLGFFLVRAVILLGIWSALATYFWRMSRKLDRTADASVTLRLQGVSAPSVLVFGVTLTLAAFDWIMSLDPHWASTIFGVYVFSGATVSSLAALALLAIVLEGSGALRGVMTAEHRHDIGKLLFGFVVFWAYIAFSQYLLIWYANIPEETVYFRERWEGSWKIVSLVLMFGHFVVPFIALLPRDAKRDMWRLGSVAALLLVVHYVDLYWLDYAYHRCGRCQAELD